MTKAKLPLTISFTVLNQEDDIAFLRDPSEISMFFAHQCSLPIDVLRTKRELQFVHCEICGSMQMTPFENDFAQP